MLIAQLNMEAQRQLVSLSLEPFLKTPKDLLFISKSIRRWYLISPLKRSNSDPAGVQPARSKTAVYKTMHIKPAFQLLEKEGGIKRYMAANPQTQKMTQYM